MATKAEAVINFILFAFNVTIFKEIFELKITLRDKKSFKTLSFF